MSITGTEQPTKVGVPIADLLAGMNGAFGVLAALHERERTGRGRVVRTSLLAGDGRRARLPGHPLDGRRARCPAGRRPPPVDRAVRHVRDRDRADADRLRLRGAVAGALRARSAGTPPTDGFATNARPGRAPRRAGRAHRDAVRRRARRALAALLADAGVPSGKVRSLDDVYGWDQTRSQGLLLEVDHATPGHGRAARARRSASTTTRTPAAGRRTCAPPTLGQHNESIREWLEGRSQTSLAQGASPAGPFQGVWSCRRTRTGGRPRTRGRRTSGGPWRRAGSRPGPSGTPARPRARCATTPGPVSRRSARRPAPR